MKDPIHGHLRVQQKKLTARRRRRAFLLSLYSVAAAGLLVCALSYISQLDALSIQSAVVRGNSRLSVANVQSLAFRDISGDYLGLFAKRDIFLYPKRRIESDLAALPIVRAESVSLGGRDLVITLAERSEAGQWCSGDSAGAIRDCYSLDADGFVFATADGTASSTGFIYRGALAGDPIGQHFLAPDTFKRVQSLMTDLAAMGLEPREAAINADGYANVSLAGGGTLEIKVSDDYSKVLSNLSVVLADKSIVPSLPAFLAKLDYMKLDIGEKIVYKLK